MLDQAKLMGADEVDVIATKGQSLNVDVRQGALENADRAEGTEVVYVCWSRKGNRLILGYI